MHPPYKSSDKDKPDETTMDKVSPLHSVDGGGAGALHSILYSRRKIDISSTLKEYITLMRPKQYL